MHQPRPHGRFFYGEGELGAEDAAAAELLVRRLTNHKGLGGLDSLKMARTLPSGATAVAVDAGGVLRLLIYQHQKPQPDEWHGVTHDFIPMLFSGTIGPPWLAPSDMPMKIHLTNMARRRLMRYEDEELNTQANPTPKKIPPALMRFNCRLPEKFNDFVDRRVEHLTTQAAYIRPGWWSGAMAEVVQIAVGYGRHDLDKLPDDPVERATMVLPDVVVQRIKLELQRDQARLPGYLGLPPKDGRLRFNFRPYETNGVTFDSSGAPWLTRVDARGVYAMPLPIIPATTTEAFREYMEEVGDTEILWAIDRFGGLPSGEGFPALESDASAWERAGVVVKVCDDGGFSDLDPMTTLCGWSFNSDGTEGFNTATGFNPGDKVPHCAGFKIRLRLGAAPHRGWVPAQSLEHPDKTKQAEVHRYIAALLLETSGNRDRDRAIKYKLYRVEPSMIFDRAETNDGAADVDYWDNLKLEPIAEHSGSCSRVTKGWIYPTRIGGLKLPEAAFQGCISHSIEGLYDFEIPEEYPRCDTVVYGYYIGDDLKVVKYFFEPEELAKEVESDFEDCMTVGAWTEKRYSTPARIIGELYTTDFDEREESAENYTLTTIRGEDLGYPSRPSLSFTAYFWRDAKIHRSRYFGRVTNVKHYFGNGKSVYCYTPFFMRDAIVYGGRDFIHEMRESEKAERLAVVDPNTYDAWTYDSTLHWASFDMDTSWMDTPQPGEYIPPNRLWVERHNYNPTECSDWADEGEWIPDLPADFTWLMYAGLNGARALLTNPEPKPQYHEYVIPEQIKEPEKKHKNHVSIMQNPALLSTKDPGDFHFSRSPDVFFGNVFYQDGTKVFAGRTSYANISDTGGNGSGRTRYGHTGLVDHKTVHYFIGVINE